MRTSADLWAELGEVGADELPHVVHALFACYEKQQKKDPDSPEAQHFFRNLALALEQVRMCNLNRR